MTLLHDRMQTMAKLILGHAVEIVRGDDAAKVYLRVGDDVFSDRRDVYPSETLLARVTLAVEAQGLTREAFAIGDLAQKDIANILGLVLTGGSATYLGRRVA